MFNWNCQRCGACCCRPGFVRLTGEDADRLAEYLKLTPEAFIETYTVLSPNRSFLTLKDKETSPACVFYSEDEKGKGKGCAVYSARPQQCRDFPLKWNFEKWRDVCLSARKCSI